MSHKIHNSFRVCSTDKINSMWIPKNRLHYPHESQVEKFRRPEARVNFRKFYNLATDEAASTGIDHFSLQILTDCEACNAQYQASSPARRKSPSPRRRSVSGMFFSDAGSPARGDDLESDDDQERRKRPRREPHSSTNPGPSGLFTPTPSDEPTDQPHIKTEEEQEAFAAMNHIPKNDLVTIYVGSNSHEHKIPRSDLGKSPVLMSWLKTDSDQPYVMHPNLTGVNNQHFASLIRFMHKGEYLPKVVDIATGMNDRAGTAVTRKGLDKLMTSDEYSAQLVRAGHLYKLAEKFQVLGFAAHVYYRIAETEFCPYNRSALLDLANIIFSRPGAVAPDSDDDTNKLEAWILTKIGWEFQAISKKHSTQLFKVVAKTGRSQFFQRLLKRKVDLVDEAGGEPEMLD